VQRLVSPLLAAALLGAAGPATAADPVRFAWVRGDGADACASQQTIADRVAARLGQSPFSAGAARSIEATVSRAEHGFRVALYVRDREGRLLGAREIPSEDTDCGPIEAASVLAIALAIDPEGALGPPPAPAPPLPSPPRIEPPPPLPAAPAAPPAPPAPLPLSGLALRGGVGLGLLPGASPALSLAGEVALSGPASLTASALWMPEARTDDGRFGFGLAAFSLGACVALTRSPVADLGACASVWAGALHAVVYDLRPATPGDYAWAAASLTPRVRFHVAGRVHAEVGAHLFVPFTRPPFEVSGWKDPVFRQSPLAALPFAALGAHFP
jgi:hypothetical protein